MTDLEDLPLAVPHSPFPGLVVERRGFFGTVAAVTLLAHVVAT